MHFDAIQILTRKIRQAALSALAKLHETPKPCIRTERKGCPFWPLAKHRVEALVRWPCFGAETVDLSQTWFGDQLCADLRAICTVFATTYELRRSSGTWFGGPLCADLRAICTICIVFTIIYELRRSSGTWDFIILNKGLMRPPRRKKAKGSHARHQVQNLSPIFVPSPRLSGKRFSFR